MSLQDCLMGKVQQGRLTHEQARRVLDQAAEFERRNLASMSPDLARTEAARQTAEAIDAEAARTKRLTNLRILRTQEVVANMNSHPKGPATGAISHLVRDVSDNATWANVDVRKKTVLGQLHAKWADGLERLRPRKLGFQRNRARQRAMLREVFGEDSGDEIARSLARSWSEAAEYARQRFNAAGGAIPHRANWGLPQQHNSRAVAEVSKDEWIDFVWDRLDREAMREATGRNLDDQELLNGLDVAYERIRTNGLNEVTPGAQGSRSVVQQGQEHRFLVFADADSWLEYQQRFGTGDVYSTMVSHFDRMSRDIALAEVLGPNPDHMVRYVKDVVRQQAAIAGEEPPNTRLKHMEDIYNIQTGRAQVPVNQGFADWTSGVRNIMTSAQLGGAFLSATSDLAYQRLARKFNGLPQVRVLKDLVKLMNPASDADRKAAVQLGLTAEDWAMQALGQKRFYGEVFGPQITRNISDAVMQASLLSPWTQAGRWSFGMEFLSTLTRHSDRSLDELPTKLNRAMRRYGITPRDWSRMTQGRRFDYRGQRLIWPAAMAEEEGGLEAANKLQQMILQESEYAIPSVDSRTMALTTGGLNPGEWKGEMMRTVAMYKSFPITVLTTHVMRGLTKNGTQRGKYLADLFISATLFGGLAYQLKQIQRGKDPISMDPESEEGRRFWLSAMWQGGGLGIFGDFMFGDVNRFGYGPTMTLVGPGAQLFDQSLRLTVGNVREGVLGQETGAGGEALRFVNDYMPGGTLWYGRAAMERLIFDQLEEKIDPDAQRGFRRQEQRARRDYGQRYWWRPGEPTPSRAPDFEQAVEE